MCKSCAPLLAEAECIQGLLKEGKKHLAQKFNFSYRYIDEVLSLNNSKISEFIELICSYELEIKNTTEPNAPASYVDGYLYIVNGKLVTRFYDKRDDFNFPIVE